MKKPMQRTLENLDMFQTTAKLVSIRKLLQKSLLFSVIFSETRINLL